MSWRILGCPRSTRCYMWTATGTMPLMFSHLSAIICALLFSVIKIMLTELCVCFTLRMGHRRCDGSDSEGHNRGSAEVFKHSLPHAYQMVKARKVAVPLLRAWTAFAVGQGRR